jgi:hypothetical protein
MEYVIVDMDQNSLAWGSLYVLYRVVMFGALCVFVSNISQDIGSSGRLPELRAYFFLIANKHQIGS